jgi:hypothetical protein
MRPHFIALSFATLATLGATDAGADKAPPPPPSPHVVVTRVATEACGQGDKDVPCAKSIVDATATAAAEITRALAQTPVVCAGAKAGRHAVHLYWGDGFGSVVHIDFDPETAGLPECAGDLVHVATDRLTAAIKPLGDKDDTLRVNWTIDFTLAR